MPLMGGLKLPLVLVVTFCSAVFVENEVAPPSSVSISASSTSTWSLQSPTPPWGSRSGHSFSATANNTVFIIGGYGLLSSLSSSTPPTRASNPPLMSPLIDVWSSSDLVTWSIQTANASFGSRIDGAVAAGVVVDEVTSSEYTLLLITGGRRPAGGGAGGGPLGKLLNDCYASVDNGATWALKSGGSLGSANSLPAMYGHSLVYFGDNTFVSLGGFTPRAISDVYYTTDGGATWVAKTPQKTWAPRAFMSAAVYNSIIYICGGTDLKQSFSDMYIGKGGVTLLVWTQAGALQSPWGSRDSAALLIAQDVLWIIGGRLGAIDPITGVSIASDVWRSSSQATGNPSSTQWELVEDNSVFGPRFGMGAVALMSTTPSSLTSSSNVTLFIFGGLSAQLSPGSQFSPIPVSDVWKSSYNLFCENASVVCNGHGSCPSQGMNKPLSTTMTTSSLPSKHKMIDATTITYTGGLPPLPVTCDCNQGYTGSRCEELVCNSKTCVHGKCKIATRQAREESSLAITYTIDSVGSDADPPQCICDDKSLWIGPNCNIAVCAPGCLHGSCSLLPGGCRCESGWAGALCNEEAGLLRTVGFFITINAGNSFLTVTLLGVLTVCFAVISVNRAAIGAPSLYELAVSARKTKSLKELMPLLPTSSSSSRSGSGPNTSSTNRGGEQRSLFYVGGGETLYSSSSTSSSAAAAASTLDKSAGGNSSSGSSGSGDDSSSSLSNLTASERLARKVRAVDGATPLRSDGIMRSRHGEAVAFSPKRRIATVNNNNSTNSLQQSFLTNSEEEGGGGGALMMNTPVGQLKDDDRDRDLRHTHSALAILSGGGENGYGSSSKRRVRFHAVQEDVRYFDVNDALPILQPLTSPSGPASLRMQKQQQQQQ